MTIQIFSNALYLGDVSTEHGELGWINTFTNQRVGRVEIDWGDDDQADHLAFVYKGEECIANITLDRYIPSEGIILQRGSRIGKIVLESRGTFSIYRGDRKVGTVTSTGDKVGAKHLILLGGGAAVVLLGV